MLYELVVNTEVQDRLRDEIVTTNDNFNGKITYEGLMKMRYMDMVVSGVTISFYTLIITRHYIAQYDPILFEQVFNFISKCDTVIFLNIYKKNCLSVLLEQRNIFFDDFFRVSARQPIEFWYLFIENISIQLQSQKISAFNFQNYHCRIKENCRFQRVGEQIFFHLLSMLVLPIINLCSTL